MKITKAFSLDADIAQKLENEQNASEVVNIALGKHYSLDWAKRMPPELLKRRIELLKQKEAIEKELEEQKNGYI